MNVRIVVLVPTYNRPALLVETLESLRAQAIDEPFDVIVVDNQPPAFQGIAAAEAWASLRGWAHRLHVVEAHEPGVAHCRNKGFDFALAMLPSPELLVLIDDDAVAEADWLRALVDTSRRLGADLAAGPVRFEFEPDIPSWMARMSPFRMVTAPTGFSDGLRGACNTAVRCAFLRHLSRPFFDPRFSAGGEDTDFFVRCRNASARIVWCAEALVLEKVPADRTMESWLELRMTIAGRTAGRVARKQSGFVRALAIQSMLVTRAVLGSFIRQLKAKDPGDKVDARLRRRFALGRMQGLFERLPDKRTKPEAAQL